MADRHKCVYCKYWITSPVKKQEGSMIRRKCKTRNRMINKDSNSCKYFDPHNVIWCDNYSQRVEMVLCLQRRRNPHNFKKTYNLCRKCRQFDQDLQDLFNDYYFGNAKIISPEVKQKGRVIKRRKGHEKKRVIKRRKKPVEKKKRTITRRKKKRVIKRR